MAPGDVNVVLRRLDDQDIVLSEIKAEAKKTNGRITALEADKIARDARAQLVAELAAKDDTRQVRRQDTFRWRAGFLITVTVGASAVSAAVAQLLG